MYTLFIKTVIPCFPSYPHPYKAELEAFANSLPSLNEMMSEDFPVKPLDSSYQYVDTPDTLEQMMKSLSMCKYIAVDLEVSVLFFKFPVHIFA